MSNFRLKDVRRQFFIKSPKELTVWDFIGKVNKENLNAPKFTHW
jgi:hypothetical protein